MYHSHGIVPNYAFCRILCILQIDEGRGLSKISIFVFISLLNSVNEAILPSFFLSFYFF